MGGGQRGGPREAKAEDGLSAAGMRNAGEHGTPPPETTPSGRARVPDPHGRVADLRRHLLHPAGARALDAASRAAADRLRRTLFKRADSPFHDLGYTPVGEF